MQGASVTALDCIGKISGHGTHTDHLPSSSKRENPEGLTMRASKEKEDCSSNVHARIRHKATCTCVCVSASVIVDLVCSSEMSRME